MGALLQLQRYNTTTTDTTGTLLDAYRKAARVANIASYIEALPLGYNTMIGQDGQGISQGQRQRILIARVVYKNPMFVFLDEATNALDANNERAITENLSEFYKGKTVVVVAHRLSTVRNANQIVVLDEGRIVEVGNWSGGALPLYHSLFPVLQTSIPRNGYHT